MKDDGGGDWNEYVAWLYLNVNNCIKIWIGTKENLAGADFGHWQGHDTLKNNLNKNLIRMM